MGFSRTEWHELWTVFPFNIPRSDAAALKPAGKLFPVNWNVL